MVEQATFTYDISSMFLTLKKLFIFLLTLKFVTTTSNNRTNNHKTVNHSCYACVEPLIGYSMFNFNSYEFLRQQLTSYYCS